MTSCLPTPEDGRGVDFLQVSPTPPVLFRFPLLPTAPDLPCRVFLERRLSRETGAVIMTAGISVQFDFSERHHRAIVRRRTRSEEHTSELQSLMRISYAVFCLKKKL